MLTHVRDNGIDVVSFEGEMTIYDIEALSGEFLPILAQTKELVIDLKNVTEIDSSGAQLLMLARKECLRIEKPFSLINHSSAVVKLFEVLGLLSWFNDPVVLSGNA